MHVAGFYIILRFFELPVNFAESASILAFHQLSGIIGVTPGGVGVQEAAGIVVAGELGLDITEMVMIFALIRAARIGISILVGAPCWWLLARGMKGESSSEKCVDSG